MTPVRVGWAVKPSSSLRKHHCWALQPSLQLASKILRGTHDDGSACRLGCKAQQQSSQALLLAFTARPTAGFEDPRCTHDDGGARRLGCKASSSLRKHHCWALQPSLQLAALSHLSDSNNSTNSFSAKIRTPNATAASYLEPGSTPATT